MEVQCEICKAEYEFDDALVTSRGTTVRCTQCGHQFKVWQAEAAEGVDEWVVLTARGDELRFRALRDLQRAILEKHVTRSDLFIVGNGEPRALGSVVELEPFFDGLISSHPPAPAVAAPVRVPPDAGVPRFALRSPGEHDDVNSTGSAHGEGQRQAGSTGEVHAGRERPSEPEPSSSNLAEPPASGPDSPRKRMQTLRPPDQGTGVPPPSVPEPGGPNFAPAVAPRQSAPPVAVPSQIASLPVPTQSARRTPAAPASSEVHSSTGSDYSSPVDEPPGHVRRRHVGGWIVTVTLLVALSVVGWSAVRPYLLRPRVPVASPADGRVAGLLDAGERALLEGDIDAAEEAFDKASALSEHDSRVLRDQSRLAAAKADVPWLALKLLAKNANSEQRTATAQLETNVARAMRTAKEAYGLAPDDPANACALTDALRLEGSVSTARGLVSKVVSSGGGREVAYVLAALDLTEPEPMWSTVIERLRAAASSDVQAGRARAALVYALARSGDKTGAATELAKLDMAKRPYPLLPTLHAWLDGLGAPPAVSAAHSAARKSGGPLSAITAPQSGTEAAQVEGASGDVGLTLQAAAIALHSGAYSRAEHIYTALVARNERDSEALSGLGDVAHAQGDVRGAMAAYRRAIAVNPSYLPALVGLADAQWAAGDQTQARRAYANVVDHFPEGAYPAYVKERSQEPQTVAPSAEQPPAAAPSATHGAADHGPPDEDRDRPSRPPASDDDR